MLKSSHRCSDALVQIHRREDTVISVHKKKIESDNDKIFIQCVQSCMLNHVEENMNHN